MTVKEYRFAERRVHEHASSAPCPIARCARSPPATSTATARSISSPARSPRGSGSSSKPTATLEAHAHRRQVVGLRATRRPRRPRRRRRARDLRRLGGSARAPPVPLAERRVREDGRWRRSPPATSPGTSPTARSRPRAGRRSRVGVLILASVALWIAAPRGPARPPLRRRRLLHARHRARRRARLSSAERAGRDRGDPVPAAAADDRRGAPVAGRQPRSGRRRDARCAGRSRRSSWSTRSPSTRFGRRWLRRGWALIATLLVAPESPAALALGHALRGAAVRLRGDALPVGRRARRPARARGAARRGRVSPAQQRARAARRVGGRRAPAAPRARGRAPRRAGGAARSWCGRPTSSEVQQRPRLHRRPRTRTNARPTLLQRRLPGQPRVRRRVRTRARLGRPPAISCGAWSRTRWRCPAGARREHQRARRGPAPSGLPPAAPRRRRASPVARDRAAPGSR